MCGTRGPAPAGAVLAAATDLTFNLRGYLAVLSNDVLTSLYLILVKDTPVTNGLSTTGMLFYNSTLSLPLLLAATIVAGEPRRVALYPALMDRQFQVVLLLASALGLTINHSTFVCTRVNEPLMTSVAGVCLNVVHVCVLARMAISSRPLVLALPPREQPPGRGLLTLACRSMPLCRQPEERSHDHCGRPGI